MKSSSVVLFFIDGLGIGERTSSNPFSELQNAAPLAVFQNETPNRFLDGIVVPTDPTLGVDGRPQSASGQTTILTGINAPQVLGYHKQGFPNKALLEILEQHSIFRQLKEAGVAPITFANAYTKFFFETRPRWISATTAAVEAAKMSFRTLDDLIENNAVYQDFTNRLLIERGEVVVQRTPEEAATVLASIASGHRFTLYEYFITDKIGHAQDMTAAKSILTELASFIRHFLMKLDLKRTTVILTSDHGNIEDLSSKNHTLHQVPTIIWGTHRERAADRIKSLVDITPTIVDLLTEIRS
jgi:2,3-bisphosphoglycerate-independent phosphoglycerate mutase